MLNRVKRVYSNRREGFGSIERHRGALRISRESRVREKPRAVPNGKDVNQIC
jgi:hypothetical protein